MAVLQNIQVPLLSVNDTLLTITELSKVNGSIVKKGDLIMVFETSKTTYDVIAESDGFVQYNCVAGNEYEVNETVAVIFSTREEVNNLEVQSEKESNGSKGVERTKLNHWTGDALISKKARALIEERKVDPSIFAGKDFVSVATVEELLGIIPERVLASRDASPPVPKFASLTIDKEKVIVERLNSAKKKEIEYLSDIQATGLTSTVNSAVEIEGIFDKVNPSLRYFKNSLLPLIIYESARLLRKYPFLNAYYSDNQIAIYKDVNIGFAIDIDKGLKVVRINKADKCNLAVIEQEMLDLSGKYIDDRLDYSDLSDITFTITDLSGEDVSFFRPLVNRMNSSILGISSVDSKLSRCILSLTFDHRVTEGKAAARFLTELKSRIESYKGDIEEYRISQTKCYKCLKTISEDLGDIGFIRCVTPKGKDAFICESCLKGF